MKKRIRGYISKNEIRDLFDSFSYSISDLANHDRGDNSYNHPLFLLWPDEVCHINEMVMKAEGRESNIISDEKLHSSVLSVYNSYDEDVRTTALKLAQAILIAHPFQDGNKRTALISMLSILKMNGYVIDNNIENQRTLSSLMITLTNSDYNAEDFRLPPLRKGE